MSPINTLSILAFASAALAVPFGHDNSHAHLHKHNTRTPTPQGTSGQSSAPSYGESSSAPIPPYPTSSSSGAPYSSGAPWGATGAAAPTGYSWSASASVAPASSAPAYSAPVGGTVTATQTIVVSPTPAPAGWPSTGSPIENAQCTPDTTVTTTTTEVVYVTANAPAGSSPVVPASGSPPAYSSPASSAYSAPAATSGAPAPANNAAPAATSGASPSPASSASSQSKDTSPGGLITPLTSGLTGGKRGLAYNDASLVTPFIGLPNIGFAYNWVSGSAGLAPGVPYIPELHDMTETFTSVWDSEVQTAIAGGSQYVFGFNEPDIPSQANLSPEAAAAGWMQYINPLAAQGVKLVAPAVSNSNVPGQGLEWLSAFMAACSECHFDAVNVHWYDYTSNDISSLQDQINAASSQSGGLPVFVGEFGFIGSSGDITSALEQALPWLDSQDNVLGYAYYYLDDGLLLDGTSPSAYGLTYLG